MKIREGATFTKQPRWEPTEEYKAVLTEKRRLHRLCNPKRLQPEVTEETEEHREYLNKVRKFKHTNAKWGLEVVNSTKFVLRTKKRTKVIATKRELSTLKSVKLSIMELNRYVMVKMGWKPKTPNVRRKTKRQEMIALKCNVRPNKRNKLIIIKDRVWIKYYHRGQGDGMSYKERRYKKRKSEGHIKKYYKKIVA